MALLASYVRCFICGVTAEQAEGTITRQWSKNERTKKLDGWHRMGLQQSSQVGHMGGGMTSSLPSHVTTTTQIQSNPCASGTSSQAERNAYLNLYTKVIHWASKYGTKMTRKLPHEVDDVHSLSWLAPKLSLNNLSNRLITKCLSSIFR